MELFSLFFLVSLCGTQNEASFEQLKEYRIRIKYSRGIKVTAGLHPSTTTVFNEIEEEVGVETTKYEAFFKRSGDLDVIYKEEDPLKATIIALILDKTAVYDFDKHKDYGSDKQQ